jgi:hypothetical protein
MIFTLGARFRHRLGLRFGLLRWLVSRFGSALRPGRRFCRLDQLGDTGLDGLVGRQLRLGVKLEIAPGPVQGVDDSIVAGLPIALRVEKMPEQEVKGGRLPVPIADGKGTRGALALSRLQKRSKGNVGPPSKTARFRSLPAAVFYY